VTHKSPTIFNAAIVQPSDDREVGIVFSASICMMAEGKLVHAQLDLKQSLVV